jgi:protein phosphatase
MTEMRSQFPQLTFAEACDRGKVREENQDHVRHISTPLGELVIVADGIGGYRGGAVASRMVVDTIESWFNSVSAGTSPAQAIAEAAAHANTSVMEAAASGDSVFSRMGSTVVLALVTHKDTETQAWIGHIGDSRAYLSRGGQLNRLTRDHSAVQMLIDQGTLDPADARKHPDASVLLRSIGHEAESEIEMSLVTLEERDTLLLCTDGLWGYVQESDIEHIMADADADLETTAHNLLNLALNAGGPDNIGIELVRLSPGIEPVEDETSGNEIKEHQTSGHEITETDFEPPTLLPSAAAERKPAGAWPKTVAYILLVAAAGAVLGWFAEREHWIPEMHRQSPSSTNQ